MRYQPGSSADGGPDGKVAAAISTATVQLLHKYTGRGPTKARTTIADDLVVVVLADTLSKAEQSLASDGKSAVVLAVRSEFQDTMSRDLVATVERHTGRRVLAFMSANNLDPDMAAEVFVLEPREAAALAEASPEAPR